MVDVTNAWIQNLLFMLFATVTSILAAIIGPMYDGLLVPELSPSALFPPITAAPAGSFFSVASSFSSYLLVNLVDPLVAVVGLAVGLAYLGRSFLGSWAEKAEPLVGRLVLSVLVANFTLPIAGAVLDLAAAAYPVISSFDGGRWQHWVYLAGFGEYAFSWDNGILAFVITFAIFSLVLLLCAAVALRNALLAVLLVLLPLFTLLWPIPALAPLARRGWLLFGQLAFLPCVLVVPLELAVGSGNILLLLGFLTVALSSPGLLSLAGAQLNNLGFSSAGGVVAGGTQRGLASASAVTGSWIRPMTSFASRGAGSSAVMGVAGKGLSSAAFPASLPLLGAEFLGRGTAHLVQHLAPKPGNAGGRDRFGALPTSPGKGSGHA